jgi:hypothetical protein
LSQLLYGYSQEEPCSEGWKCRRGETVREKDRQKKSKRSRRLNRENVMRNKAAKKETDRKEGWQNKAKDE